MSIRLSICIPTYNFGSFIGETLESIISQATSDIEIVVVDGASTDSTAEVVRKYKSIFPRLRYCRLDKKGGIDHDLAIAVSLATGRYCWLFSSDDVMKPLAISKVLHEIEYGYDVYLCGFTLCSLDMRPIGGRPMFDSKSEAIFDLGDKENRLEYFRKAKTTTALFSFTSALIIKKERWDRVEMDKRFAGTYWGEAVRIFTMLADGLKVKYLPEPLLFKRDDNDSFMDKGLINRIRISIEGYCHIGAHFFGENSQELFHIRRTLREEYPFIALLNIKTKCLIDHEYEQLSQLDSLVELLYSGRTFMNWTFIHIYKLMPMLFYKPLYSFAKELRTRIRQGSALHGG